MTSGMAELNRDADERVRRRWVAAACEHTARAGGRARRSDRRDVHNAYGVRRGRDAHDVWNAESSPTQRR